MMTTPTADRTARLRAKYGIELDTWQRMWDACRGHCPLCEKPYSSVRLACVDHNHQTGAIRGLICSQCNYAIGERHDNAGWFERVGAYLSFGDAYNWGYVPGSIGEHRMLDAINRVQDAQDRYTP